MLNYFGLILRTQDSAVSILAHCMHNLQKFAQWFLTVSDYFVWIYDINDMTLNIITQFVGIAVETIDNEKSLCT